MCTSGLSEARVVLMGNGKEEHAVAVALLICVAGA